MWGHFAPLFHLVDVFAVYAITLVRGRHVTLRTFTPLDTLLLMGAWVRPLLASRPGQGSG